VGRLTRLPVPKALRAPLWRAAAARLGVDLGEVARDLVDYASFDAFFTRRLRAGSRPLDVVPKGLLVPADGQLTHLSDAVPDTVLVKGRQGSLEAWLDRFALPWRRPSWAVVYLSPRDYHWVHAPVSGEVLHVSYRPGHLLPVNPSLVGDGRLVFGCNERVTVWLEGPAGPVAVCLVGAACVGGIGLAFDTLRANAKPSQKPQRRDYRAGTVPMRAGDPLGVFHMGSSVVLAWEGDGFSVARGISEPRGVQLGQLLGHW
jgi:phosphatidylserine decarboxylase